MTTLPSTSPARPLGRSRMPRGYGLALSLVRVIETWLERRRQRLALLELGDHMLKDIGLTRLDAYREGHKPFWLP